MDTVKGGSRRRGGEGRRTLLHDFDVFLCGRHLVNLESVERTDEYFSEVWRCVP